MSKIRRVVWLVVLYLGLVSGPQPLHAQDVPSVLVKSLKEGLFFPSFQHPARIEALQTATVRPIVRGQITAIHVTAGQVVTKGSLLIELDATDYRIAVAEANAGVLRAQANLVRAQADFERAQELVQRNVQSVRDLDLATAVRDVAEAELAIARARVESAEKALADTKVYAPFDGRVGKPNYAVGDLFQPGDPSQPALVLELVSLDPIYAVGRVDQVNYFQFIARRLKLEQDGQSIPPLELTLRLPGGTTYEHHGIFENWDNTAVASSGTIAARIRFPNPDGLLLPGENVTVHGELIEPVKGILVPQRAVSQDQQGHFVLVVNAEGTVERRNIEVGIRNGADWSVRSGLSEGDVVIVEGLQKARLGQPVVTKDYEG
ncbi:efflux RND transporter periplasmic adaptor subunit [Seohaeicola saemankumensis]|nr:efflux RND transporter periplasmic adaptor subunit [Seohaeicola saemankumensis]MCA0871468.1 efflux RND transporter periplasmic adaptor subunit [Seohaeicola saemankumensis]